MFGAPYFLIERAEAEVAVGGEGAHTQLLGQRQGLLVVSVGLLDRGRIGRGGDLRPQSQRIRLAATLRALPGQVQGPLGVVGRLLPLARQQVRLGEPPAPEGMRRPMPRGTFFQRTLEVPDGLPGPVAEDERVTR